MSDLCCRAYTTTEGEPGLCGLPLGHTGRCGMKRVEHPVEMSEDAKLRAFRFTYDDDYFDRWERRAELEKPAREVTSCGGTCWK